MNNKILGAIVILVILGGGSILIYNWKAIAPYTIQTTTTATKISQMIGKIKIQG